MGFLKMNSDLWSHATLVDFGSKYLKKLPPERSNFSSINFFMRLGMSDKIISSKQFCREFFSLSFETNHTPIGWTGAEKDQKYWGHRILAKNKGLAGDVVSVSAITLHRLNQKVSYFYHKLFRLWSIEWQPKIEI